MPVLANMEKLGSRIYLDVVNKLLRYYRAYSKKQARKMAELGYPDFNPRSPKEKKEYFIDKMGYEPIRYTDAGNPSCDGEFLKHCAEVHKDPMARAVLEMSNAEIAISSHFQTWHDLGIPDTPGSNVIVLHPSFKQTGTRTGRISCTRPNLMNVPSEQTGKRKSKVAMKGRQCFGPRPGYYWYLPDYSQVEVRLFAYLSKSKEMVQAILDGDDFHSYVTKQVWGWVPDYEARPRYYRKRGKQINFTKLYGGGPRPVAMELECTHEEAKQFIKDYDERLPDVKRFMDEIKNEVIRNGFIVSPFGRHYYMDSRFAYRATNYIVQGTAGDIMKRGMIYIDAMLKRDWPEAHLLIQVHDEVCIEIPKKYHSKKLMRQIIFEMQRGADLIQVPGLVKADMKFTSSDWSRTTEIELEVA